MPVLIVVEDLATACKMQKDIPAEVVEFVPAMKILDGGTYTKIFVKWPSDNWFASRHFEAPRFQDWVRMHLMRHLKRGGEFQYF